MDFSRVQFGVLHSVLGGDDGVSIVIDQTLEVLRGQLGVPAANIHLLAGRAEGGVRAETDESLWHLSEPNRRIFERYSGEAPEGLGEYIRAHALKARDAVAGFLAERPVDVLIAHNSCHVSNFVYGLGLDLYFSEGGRRPKYMVWWHDSHLERERFARPNGVIRSFLGRLPGRGLLPQIETLLVGLGCFLKSKSIVIGQTKLHEGPCCLGLLFLIFQEQQRLRIGRDGLVISK